MCPESICCFHIISFYRMYSKTDHIFFSLKKSLILIPHNDKLTEEWLPLGSWSPTWPRPFLPRGQPTPNFLRAQMMEATVPAARQNLFDVSKESCNSIFNNRHHRTIMTWMCRYKSSPINWIYCRCASFKLQRHHEHNQQKQDAAGFNFEYQSKGCECFFSFILFFFLKKCE